MPPVTPLTLQVTAVFNDPVTVAVNCWVWDTATEALVGDTVTDTVEIVEVIVTIARPDFDGSALLVAVTVALAGDGTVVGAV